MGLTRAGGCGIMSAQFNISHEYMLQICLGVYKISRLNLRFFIDFFEGLWYNIIVQEMEPPKGDECPISAILPRYLD